MNPLYNIKWRNAVSPLVDETENLASNVLPASLLVVHDTSRGGQDDVAELTRGEKLVDPVLEVVNLDIETGRDNANLVETAVEEDSDLACTVVVNELEVVNVACKVLVLVRCKMSEAFEHPAREFHRN